MRGKTAKLLRRVAKTNPYKSEKFEENTLYSRHQVKNNILMSPGLRLTYKYLKKFYKRGNYTTNDLRKELENNA